MPHDLKTSMGNKERLIQALELTARAYFLPTARTDEKSVEWEVCKVYKGDCEACIWSVYGKPDIKTGKFPCQQRPLPAVDPALTCMKKAEIRAKLFRRLAEWLKKYIFTMSHTKQIIL